MSDLIADLKAAIEEKNEKVRQCEAALTEARSDRDAFAKKIADELGFATIPQSDNRIAVARDRRTKVIALHEAGNSIDEIAEQLQVKRGTIDNDLCSLRELGIDVDKSITPEIPVEQPRSPQPAPVISSKRQRALEMFRKGESRQAIADALEMSLASVYTHLSALRKNGEIVAGETSSQSSDDVEADEHEQGEPDIDDGRQDSTEKGASKEALKTEVARQQNGIRGKVVMLGCTLTKQHRHTVRVDRMGDGHTTPDASGHVHRCYRFILSAAHGHAHDVTITKGEA